MFGNYMTWFFSLLSGVFLYLTIYLLLFAIKYPVRISTYTFWICLCIIAMSASCPFAVRLFFIIARLS